MKKLSLLFSMMMFVVGFTMAQRTVTGTITDVDGLSLIGANVTAEGTTVGTITDIDGNFTLKVPADVNALVVSYTGFTTKNIPLGTSDVVNVVLLEGLELGEVVVTATGIDRNSREISYANQTVSSEDLNSAPNKNALEALRGKAAGVKITTGSGSVGASNRIVLRGESSLTGNNNALIVVDGIPIDNASSRGGATTGLFSAQDGYADYGNRFNDLNPEDIESVTVLKGASATSLYGSRGASGVLVITTKKGSGKDGKVDVSVNSTTSVEQAYVLLQRQDRYGQGFGLPFAANPSFDSGENWSWGPEFDGVVRPWTSPVDADGDGNAEFLSRPYSAVPNQLENFFRTGRTFANNFALSGTKGGYDFYASYGNVKQFGILDNTDYTRHNIKISAGAKLTEKLKASVSITYANTDQNTALEGYRPFEGQNAYANAVQSPVNIPLHELRDYNSPYHNFDGYYGSYTSNPYFILNEFGNHGNINNLLGAATLNYEPIPKLNLMARFGINNVSTNLDESIPVYQYNPHFVWFDNLDYSLRGNRSNNVGEYFELEGVNINKDYTLQANYLFDLNESGSLTLSPTVGWNLFQRSTRTLSSRTVGGLIVEDWYNLGNSQGALNTTETNSDYWLYGIYGQLQFGYQNKLFFDYSARNDYSSTLPPGSNSFFYQAVGASAIISEFVDFGSPSGVSFMKLRASYGTTGKDAPLYALYARNQANPTIQSLANGHDLFFPHNANSGVTVGNQIGNDQLKPELTTTAELGLDAGFFENKVNLEYTYYSSNHKDQLVIVNLPSSTGFSSTTLNIGEMTNKGHELKLNLKPIDGMWSGVTWDVDFLYAKNTNEVVEIIDPETDGNELVVGNLPGEVDIYAIEGQPYGTFKGTVNKTTPDGRVIVDATGLPVEGSELVNLGSYQPDYTLSYGTTVGYKGLKLNVLFDQKVGGHFLSFTKDLVEFNGTSLTTLIGDRGAFVVENSVVENPDGTYSENTVATNPYDFIRNEPFSTHLIDASFIKLRELGLTYQLSNSLLNKLPFSNLSVGVFAKNLKFWLPEENTFADPEVNGPGLTGNATGVETTQTPPSRSFGVRLSANF